jgi:hypothetical protein
MKKTFQLTSEKLNPDRYVESIKNEVRKYIKREKKKKLPEGMDYWHFNCKFGNNDDAPKVILFANINKSISAAVTAECTHFYLEIISSATKREKKERPES